MNECPFTDWNIRDRCYDCSITGVSCCMEHPLISVCYVYTDKCEKDLLKLVEDSKKELER